MELNDYNNGFDHCKSEMVSRRCRFQDPATTIVPITDLLFCLFLPPKNQAALLAPDPNNFIMDLMNFPKGVVSSNTHVGVGPDADPTLPPDLHFHNAHLFPVTTDDHNSHNHHNHHHHHHHSNEPRKSPTYLPLNSSDFLMPVTTTKTYNTSSGSVETVEDGSVKVVQELLMNGSSVALDVSIS